MAFKKFSRGRRISPGLCDAVLQEYFIPLVPPQTRQREKAAYIGHTHVHLRRGLEGHAATIGDPSGKERAADGVTVFKKGKGGRQLWFYDGTASLHAAELKKDVAIYRRELPRGDVHAGPQGARVGHTGVFDSRRHNCASVPQPHGALQQPRRRQGGAQYRRGWCGWWSKGEDGFKRPRTRRKPDRGDFLEIAGISEGEKEVDRTGMRAVRDGDNLVWEFCMSVNGACSLSAGGHKAHKGRSA